MQIPLIGLATTGQVSVAWPHIAQPFDAVGAPPSCAQWSYSAVNRVAVLHDPRSRYRSPDAATRPGRRRASYWMERRHAGGDSPLDAAASGVARALAIVHTCIYDAWAAYDPVAAGVHYHTKTVASPSEPPASRAISYAAHRALLDLFPSQHALFSALMNELGYDPLDTIQRDSAVGIAAAQAGLDARAQDGANQADGYADYTGYASVNTPDLLVDPFAWQPPEQRRACSGFAAALGPCAAVRLDSADQFLPPPPFSRRSMQTGARSAAPSAPERAESDRRYGPMARAQRRRPDTGVSSRSSCHIAIATPRAGREAFFALATLSGPASPPGGQGPLRLRTPGVGIRYLFRRRPGRARPFLGTRLIAGRNVAVRHSDAAVRRVRLRHARSGRQTAQILRSFTGSDRLDAQVTIVAGIRPSNPDLRQPT